MRAHPRSQKSLRVSAQNQLSIAVDRLLPNSGFETQSPARIHSASRSLARARLARVSAAKTPAKVAKAARPFFLHCEKLRSHVRKLSAAPLARLASVSPSLSRPSPHGLVNQAAIASPRSSETKIVGAISRRT